MTKLKLNDKEMMTLTFMHFKLPNTPCKLIIARNPLTGDWIEFHSNGDRESAFVSTKSDALKLASKIVKKSKENNIPCPIVVEKNTIIES